MTTHGIERLTACRGRRRILASQKMTSTNPKAVTRRAFIGLAAAASVAAAVAARTLLPGFRQSLADWLNFEDASHRLPSQTELLVVASFAGALAGDRMRDDDVNLLAARLTRIARKSRQQAARYAEVSAFANRRARALQTGATGFLSATDDVREAIVRSAMSEPRSSATARLALLTDDGRARFRIREGIAGHLRELYSKSPAPWRSYGYTGWPGKPADKLDYTRPGPQSSG
jgi:hypothetical protein